MSRTKINLALQGGGAHGAFTWGVLDRVLEESEISFEGVSGTSAGAMNAVVLADGWRKGGREGAKIALREFWEAVSQSAMVDLNSALPEFLRENISVSMSQWFIGASQYLSPYQLNPLDINPLREIVSAQVDFLALRRSSPFKLFIAATEVRSGKIAVFREQELSADHLMASACLPSIHQAVEIDGVSYWDGGYSGNPAVYPLVFDCRADDLMLVLLQPLVRDEVPQTAGAIQERITELGFQCALMREMGAIAESQRQVRSQAWPSFGPQKRLKRLRAHLISSDEFLGSLQRSTKYDTRRGFLEELHSKGWEQADAWLKENKRGLGRFATCDLDEVFL